MNARYPRKVQVGASEMNIIPHALKRRQKRGIPEELMVFIITYGTRTYSHGRCRYAFSGKCKNVDVPKRLQEKLRKHPYVIVDGNEIITVGWCYKRIKKDTGGRKSYKRQGRK